MKLQMTRTKKFKPRGGGKRFLSVMLAAALLLNPLGPVAELFAGARAAAAAYLPMPEERPTVTVLNKRTADQSWERYRNSYSLAGSMKKTASSGSVTTTYSIYSDNWQTMDDALSTTKNRSWSITFENKNFNGKLSKDVECRIGTYAAVYTAGGYVYLGNGAGYGEKFSFDESETYYGRVNTGWLPYNGIKTVINGRGEARVQATWLVLADRVAPGEKGWEMEVSVDPDDGAPVLWLTCGEGLRPANETVSSGNLGSLKLRLGVVPRKTPGADPVYVTASAVKYEYDPDGSALGFRVDSGDWAQLGGEECQIISIQDATSDGNYEYTLGTSGVISVSRPVTDMAGNPVYFPTTAENVRAKGLYLDAKLPAAEVIKLSGSSVDADTKDLADEWPEDIDRSKLFSTVGDTVQMRVQLSELVVQPSQEDMGKIYLTWKNLSDKNGSYVSKLTAIENGYANGVNGDIVSTLVFEAATVPGGLDLSAFQGQRLGADKLYGGEYLLDYSRNAMAAAGAAVDLSGISPDCQNYLDTEGPQASMENAVTLEKTADEIYYVLPLHIQDGGDGVLASGVAGLTGQISLTSYANAPQMAYAYEISSSAEQLDSLSQTGTIGGEGNEIWSDFPLIGDGDYYLHVKLSDLAGKELSDEKGLTLKLQLSDVKGNGSSPAFTLTNLGLDQVAPELVVTPQGVSVSGNGSENTAVMRAEAQCSDLNGIDRIEYQWVDEGSAPAANAWKVFSGTSLLMEDSVSGLNAVSRALYVRAYDRYGNVTEKNITMKADLSKAVGRFRVVGDPDTPSADTDVMVSGPASTDVLAENASTRATVVMGENTYVRIFRGDTETSLLDPTATDWYQVTVENGKYTLVTQASPDWSYYGNIQITLDSSLKDLTPVENALVDNSADQTLTRDTELTVAYTSRQEGLHGLAFSRVENSAGSELSVDTSSADGKTYRYYKFDQTMAGARIHFSLSNLKMEDWFYKDVDFEKSYAVLLKADQEGAPIEAEEATARTLLSRSVDQVFSVPAYDKDGNAFATGTYVLKVYIQQQNEGGGQAFYLETPLLLDASGVPDRFGVTSYGSTVRTTYTNRDEGTDGLPIIQEAAEGEVLHAVNVAAVRPDGFGMMSIVNGMQGIPGTIKQIDGHNAYLTEVQNALEGSRSGSGGGMVNLEIQAQWTDGAEPGKWMGTWLGRTTGIKYWNAESQGVPADLPYQTNLIAGDGADTSLSFSFNSKWYDDNVSHDVVSREELAGKELDDFAVALGSNTICYQLQMENGVESPVYQFEINICDQAPELELDYQFGSTVIEKNLVDNDGTRTTKKYADYVDVSVKDAFSPYGAMTFYYAQYDSTANEWVYEEIGQEESVRLTQNGNGYLGFQGTRRDLPGNSYTPTGSSKMEFDTNAFLCAVDPMGNAVSAYPILTGKNNTAADEYYYGVNADTSFFETTEPELQQDGYTYEIEFSKASADRIDYYTVQMDDRTPERIDSTAEHLSLAFQNIPSSAGISQATMYGVSFVLPYEADEPEGAELTHTVTLTAYGHRENASSVPVERTVSYDITAQNVKPRVEIDTEYYEGAAMERGSVLLKRTTDVMDEAHGIYYWSNWMYVYQNGAYWLNLTDKYGEEYLQELQVEGLPEDPVIDISTTEPTAGPVEITVTSERYLLTTSLIDFPVSGMTYEGTGTKEMKITAAKNGSVTVYWGESEDGIHRNSVAISINNINAADISPEVHWLYDESMLEEGNILRGTLRAELVDRNGSQLIDPQTGLVPRYEFEPGGETTYTFSGYTNRYGKTGPDVTATLPVTLLPYEPEGADTDAPEVMINGYVTRQGKSSEIQAIYIQSQQEDAAAIHGYDTAYGEQNIFTDMDEFLAKMSWANSYMLRVTAEDQSGVRLFIRRELEETAPDYAAGTSDSIEGVTLSGRTLQITRNAEFYLYAVDAQGNYRVVPIRVTELGDLPAPEYAKVRMKSGEEVRLYLQKPDVEGIGNLQITNDEDNDGTPDAATETNADSRFYGCPYLSVKKNGPVILRYSYDYLGITATGSITVDVNDIDTNPPAEKERTWSANYDPDGESFTNQEISVQMQFDKYLGDVVLTEADGTPIGQSIPGVTVSWLENRVTVVYDSNVPKLRLKVASMVNKTPTVVDLPAITTIDREAPTVTVSGVAYSANRRSAVVTIASSEEGTLSVSGAKGTGFQRTVKENGTYTYTVIDRAGNQGKASVTVDGLITENLTLALSTAGTEDSVIDPETYEAKVGDTLYAKVNRAAALYVNGQQQEEEIAADTWTEFTLGADAEGLYPSIRAVDAYGNAALVQLVRIPMGDKTAPALLLVKQQVSAPAEKTDEELREILLANAVYSDETTPRERLKVDITFDRSSAGDRIPVTYTVTDEAGNAATDSCWLRLNDGKEPVVTVNGEAVEWDETMPVQAGTESIRITTGGEPYQVSWKAGIKTEAQLKTGANILGRNTGDAEQTFEAEFTEPGYYTFCITTQGRKTYRFVLYVEG